MKLEFHQLTTKGDKPDNQDCMANYVCQDFAVFIVADGLGGHHAGEKAAQFFCRGVLMAMRKYQPLLSHENVESVMARWMDDAVREMRLLFAGDENADKSHTTCAILYLDKERCITAHCGDSRVYKIMRQQLVWRTRDHSLTQQLLDEGKISEREMGVHPEQNQLTRSINILNIYKPEIHVYPAAGQGDCFVLCSDGFWEHVKESELIQLSESVSVKDELKRLVKLSIFRAAGRSDNVTAQFVKIVEN